MTLKSTLVTLSGGVDTTTLVSPSTNPLPDFNVVNLHLLTGADPVYITINGADPALGGADTYIIHQRLPVRSIRLQKPVKTAVIKMIGPASSKVFVEVDANLWNDGRI